MRVEVRVSLFFWYFLVFLNVIFVSNCWYGDDGFLDVYLMGIVMFIFGMGFYEFFVDMLEVFGVECEEVWEFVCGLNLFGFF